MRKLLAGVLAAALGAFVFAASPAAAIGVYNPKGISQSQDNVHQVHRRHRYYRRHYRRHYYPRYYGYPRYRPYSYYGYGYPYYPYYYPRRRGLYFYYGY